MVARSLRADRIRLRASVAAIWRVCDQAKAAGQSQSAPAAVQCDDASMRCLRADLFAATEQRRDIHKHAFQGLLHLPQQPVRGDGARTLDPGLGRIQP